METITETMAVDLALALARGSYQRDVVTGRARLSGADLKGVAKKWGARYAASRSSILARCRAAGIPFVYARWPHDHGLRTLEWGADAAQRVVAAGGLVD